MQWRSKRLITPAEALSKSEREGPRNHKLPCLPPRNPTPNKTPEKLQASISDPELCRKTMKYINTHKRRDAVEIRLHFINNN